MEIIVISRRNFDSSGVGYCVWQLFCLAHLALAFLDLLNLFFFYIFWEGNIVNSHRSGLLRLAAFLLGTSWLGSDAQAVSIIMGERSTITALIDLLE